MWMCVIIFIILGRPSLAHKFLIWMQIRSSTTNSNGYRTTVVLLLVTAGCDGHSVPLQVWPFYLSNDVNNQQNATTFTFSNLFNSALHVSGDKFAHLQEHFLTVYTAFGTMHRRCCPPVHCTKAVSTVKKCSWEWANLSPETCALN
jgi:hypothetical protein